MATTPEKAGPERPENATPATHRRGPLKTAWYWLTSTAIWVTAKTLYRLRIVGERGLPMQGPVVVLANHTSHFDPPLLGGATRRQLSYLARDTLFVGPFGWLIRSYDAVPVDRDGSGIGGIRATLKRIKQGGAVVLFPEGTRSADGRMQPFKPGFLALVRRGKATVQPVGIAGAHEVWPRGVSKPRLRGRIAMVYGEPIPPAEWAGLSDAELLELTQERVAECLRRATVANVR